ncbi:N-acetylglutamate synthase, CG3035 family [Rhodococcoides kyotonense]|uniref:N-acetylglutamate synthase, CG3035 family n=1 Tax=Rhodococcoides kyotonense TaxID=398843 RepID=UPI000B78CD09
MGARVTLRYRLPPGHSHPMTDVVGELIEHGETVVAVRARDGRVVRVSPERVVALKALGPRPIRTSEIRGLERAAADGWPGVEQEWVDGWLLRAGHGFTGRANSATPIEPGASVASVDRISRWFHARLLPPTLLLPDRLGSVPEGWTTRDETLVMAADISRVQLPEESVSLISDTPDDDWLGLYRYRGRPLPTGALDVISSIRDGVVGFGRIGSAASAMLAIGRAAVTNAPDGRRWVGLTAIEVAEAHRRNGLGTRICGELVAWGRNQGATHAYLQVSAENSNAIAMYEGLGFLEHHRYRYAAPHVHENT